MDTLLTRWARQAKCDCPLSDYPRPQMVRDNWQCLNGMYEYAITPLDAQAFPMLSDGSIRVPFAIESCLSGVCKRLDDEHLLWYRRRFSLDIKEGERTLLHFGAVDWKCTVYLNDVELGEHTGGYCPFTFDITDLAKQGENTLVLKVFDPTDKGWQSRGKQASKSHGFWYTSTSGIWQTVWTEQVNKDYIVSYKITPDIDSSSFRINTNILCDGDYTLKIKVFEGDNQLSYEQITTDEYVKLENMKLWSPENPFLYTFVLELYGEYGQLCDSVTGYFGMRKFSVMSDGKYMRLALNNKPYFQKGLLDQGYWSDGGLTPPSDEAMIYDIQTMKSLGFNMLRKHIKVENERWYYHCDRLGMIVWQDMVSGGSKPLDVIHAGVYPNIHGVLAPVKNFSYSDGEEHYAIFGRADEECRSVWEAELFDMVNALYNHTCIGCWVPFNEGWGQFDAKKIGLKLKEYDNTRIIDHASGWYDQGGCDLRSIHKYILPVVVPKNDGRPFVLSEYGGYSQIIDGHVWNKKKSFGYQMYRSKETLTKAYKALHENQIIPKIEKGLSATVYTQVSDVEFEVNGMLTYDRQRVKLDEKTVIEINKRLTY